jgi:ribonucleoside-diphosphate reductase alpha subunit
MDNYISVEQLQTFIQQRDIDYIEAQDVLLVLRSIVTEFGHTFRVQDVARSIAARAIRDPGYTTLAGQILTAHLNAHTNHTLHVMCNMNIYRHDIQDFLTTHPEIWDELDYSAEVYDYTAIQTIMKNYLLRDGKKQIIENVQQMYMRVACELHFPDVKKVIHTYHRLRLHYYTHASPTLINAGTKTNSLSSCYIIDISSNTVGDVMKTISNCAVISNASGGLGVNASRMEGNELIVPRMRILNETMRSFKNGYRRAGACAVYIEPWHIDIRTWLNMKSPCTPPELSARDLFYGLTVPDVFMYRVKHDMHWTLFDPVDTPDLVDLFGETFTAAYLAYETNGTTSTRIRARDVWARILQSQQETGTPYIIFKGNINRKNQQSNIGTITASNLCTEIMLHTDTNETACCNLAAISLPACVSSDGIFDFELLHILSQELTENLNNLTDRTLYPTQEAKHSNLKHRPIAIGVSGLADVFHTLSLPFESEAAGQLNIQIFETIYHGALTASAELAKKYGTYDSFDGSPYTYGLLQHDLWALLEEGMDEKANSILDWDTLRETIKVHGLRNSVLTAAMPTVTTSKILGNSEGCEPIQNLVYVLKTNYGESVIVNKHLVAVLKGNKLWSEQVMQQLIRDRGSIQNITTIPDHIKETYKTVWEMSGKRLVGMSASRGRFIDQSQSFNVYLPVFDENRLTSILFEGFEKGLKTGSYYVRTQAAAHAEQIYDGADVCHSCIV